jgi:hypothetical protein
MKKQMVLLLLSWAITSFAQQPRCGVEGHLTQTDTGAEAEIAHWIIRNAHSFSTRSILTIPVVVHVVWNKAEENIPDEQVFSQIEVLNADYRALNVEIPGIPTAFKNAVADTEIEFCLAQRDPEGKATNGITRKYTNNPVGIGGSPAIHYSNQGGQNAWDTERYLNIWVAKFAGGVGGIATFPNEGPPAEQGVEIDYRQFGTLNLDPPYHLGRTATHEIGHYFNLEHPWGPGINDCCEDDFVADTPEACETYLGDCPVHPVVSCSQPDMFMNYMFYTDDACMGMFSKGQKMRMLATLNTVRAGLLTSDGCDPVAPVDEAYPMNPTLSPNPVTGFLTIDLKNGIHGEWQFRMFDATGKMMEERTFRQGASSTLDVAGYAPGVYWITLENDLTSLARKVVIL